MDKIYVRKIKSMTGSGFNAIEASEDIINGLDNLCQMMFDPENQHPQMNQKQAWDHYLKLRASFIDPANDATCSHLRPIDPEDVAVPTAERATDNSISTPKDEK